MTEKEKSERVFVIRPKRQPLLDFVDSHMDRVTLSPEDNFHIHSQKCIITSRGN